MYNVVCFKIYMFFYITIQYIYIPFDLLNFLWIFQKLLGGPGSGKGTIVNNLVDMFNFRFICGEDLIMENLSQKMLPEGTVNFKFLILNFFFNQTVLNMVE